MSALIRPPLRLGTFSCRREKGITALSWMQHNMGSGIKDRDRVTAPASPLRQTARLLPLRETAPSTC